MKVDFLDLKREYNEIKLEIDTFGDKPQCLSLGKESRKPEGLKNGGFVALSINTEYTSNKFRKQTPMLAIGVYECVDTVIKRVFE